MVDQTTRWPEAVPLSSTTTAEVAQAFIDTWVARFGTPSDITSDRGPQFTSELWAEIARVLGVQLHHTTAFHPQAYGLCECLHRSLKSALRAAELVYGQTLRVPGDFIPDSTRPCALPSDQPALLERVNAFKPVPTSHHGMTTSWIPKDLSTAEFAFIQHDAHRNALRPHDGPFCVLEAGVKSFLIDIGGRPE
ncbi:Gag-Pol polyprotein [Labeo rohita]|uniref:Gag-Pol polyprotein n=1 Tax=Labeo rohita TaxID=84645 RepID=A0ABQ8L739_LABRO|nr:Gag-Pol polyprotein [Labeo rohita]